MQWMSEGKRTCCFTVATTRIPHAGFISSLIFASDVEPGVMTGSASNERHRHGTLTVIPFLDFECWNSWPVA